MTTAFLNCYQTYVEDHLGKCTFSERKCKDVVLQQYQLTKIIKINNNYYINLVTLSKLIDGDIIL